jgi:hypothetical protein
MNHVMSMDRNQWFQRTWLVYRLPEQTLPTEGKNLGYKSQIT